MRDHLMNQEQQQVATNSQTKATHLDCKFAFTLLQVPPPFTTDMTNTNMLH